MQGFEWRLEYVLSVSFKNHKTNTIGGSNYVPLPIKYGLIFYIQNSDSHLTIRLFKLIHIA